MAEEGPVARSKAPGSSAEQLDGVAGEPGFEACADVGLEDVARADVLDGTRDGHEMGIWSGPSAKGPALEPTGLRLWLGRAASPQLEAPLEALALFVRPESLEPPLARAVAGEQMVVEAKHRAWKGDGPERLGWQLLDEASEAVAQVADPAASGGARQRHM